MGDDKFKDKVVDGNFLTLSIYTAAFLAYYRVPLEFVQQDDLLFFSCQHSSEIDDLLKSFRENKTLSHFVKCCRDVKKRLEKERRQARGSS